MPTQKLDDRDWRTLLRRIKDGKCTPFLGAGVSHPPLPLGSEIAEEWATKHQYPLDDRWDLARVAQYVAIKLGDQLIPKEDIADVIRNVKAPDFSNGDEPVSVLAQLPLPVYITTNYDDFMYSALKAKAKDPKRALCRWNTMLQGEESVFESGSGYDPTPANPVVFHLHGHYETEESLVLTEDDYLNFLVNVSIELRII